MTPNLIRQPSASTISGPPPLWDDAGAALAETDRHGAFAPAMGAEDRLVAVREKGAGLARRQRDPSLAVLRQFHQAAPAFRRRAGDRAGAEDVAGFEIAAARAVMRDELRDRPIEVGRVARRHAVRRQPFVAHLAG